MNPDYSLIGQACCQLHQVGIRCKRKLPALPCPRRSSVASRRRCATSLFQRTGSGRRARTFTLRFQRPACCHLHHPGTQQESGANDRTRTCIDESHNLAPHPFGHVRHHTAGMERLELSKAGLKNLSRDRFAFIPVQLDKLQFVVGILWSATI